MAEITEVTGLDLAYFAGLVDGEGSIGIAKHKSKSCRRGHTFELVVQLNMSNPLLPNQLRCAFGGSVTEHQHKAKLWMWHWCIVARKAGTFLYAIQPYLRLKKERAKIALEFQAKKRYYPRLTNEAYAEQAKARQKLLVLNKKGLAAAYED